MEMAPAGMMLWFSQIISEGIPIKFLVVFSHVLVSVFCVAIAALAVVGVGGVAGGLMLVFAFLLLLLYWALAFKGYQFLRNGNAKLAWFQKPVWIGILQFARYSKWQGLDTKTQNRNVVSFRGKPITDAMLLQAPELKTAQILDLEGTLVTDASIERLYQLKHLQCLVLRKTDVSHLAVTRLQQSFPKLWIWY